MAICRYFQQGNCRFGNSCKNSHSTGGSSGSYQSPLSKLSSTNSNAPPVQNKFAVLSNQDSNKQFTSHKPPPSRNLSSPLDKITSFHKPEAHVFGSSQPSPFGNTQSSNFVSNSSPFGNFSSSDFTETQRVFGGPIFGSSQQSSIFGSSQTPLQQSPFGNVGNIQSSNQFSIRVFKQGSDLPPSLSNTVDMEEIPDKEQSTDGSQSQPTLNPPTSSEILKSNGEPETLRVSESIVPLKPTDNIIAENSKERNEMKSKFPQVLANLKEKLSSIDCALSFRKDHELTDSIVLLTEGSGGLFGKTKLYENIHENTYSLSDSLSDAELKVYQGESFSLGCIPYNPPPIHLCF